MTAGFGAPRRAATGGIVKLPHRVYSVGMPSAYLNRIATAVPPHDIHSAFAEFAMSLLDDARSRSVFARMAARAHISHRYSVLATELADADTSTRLYARGRFPKTAERMALYEQFAPLLAVEAVRQLAVEADGRRVTHLIVTSCTGMYAPGLDLELVERCGLDPSVERTMVGFMGCYAAINALKLARHIVRSEPAARVLLVNLELCSLHLRETEQIEPMLSYLVFGDGCAASLVSADPVGFELDRFHVALVADTQRLITWNVRDDGFEMHLSGRVPAAIALGLGQAAPAILDGASAQAIDLWAVHPGGRSVLDAVGQGLGLSDSALAPSRRVLDQFGNMSSATVMFVLEALLALARPGQRGCAMSFGPGLTAETLLFHAA